MPNLALVTGATSGIGRALAELHASKGGDLLLVARRAAELADLKAELEAKGVGVDTVAADLGTPEGLAATTAAAEGREVDLLVNNAGFGGRGEFVDRPLDDDLAMVDLNVKAVMALCHAVGGDMANRGRGRILNVGSTAGHMPGPLQATYFATKAFVRSFSFALDAELRPKGVTVTVLAPGYVETGFAARADLEGTKLTKSGATPADVAKVGYDGAMAGKLEVINDRKLALMLNTVGRVAPARAMMAMIRDMQTK
ncbi:SDR family oxidoreductase [Jannaschia sp. Os4]|uniref:SDR family NAD(P)-dependent oxidoreductase n=1 Tax=Jannaschia sp. Os4 TaxID=2807617 RepID=UPI001939E641|nr:SDR family oxidoreductase [Jannaschia sp. Os4]MBM2577937.1 SDR family oxidoreductase [Jannaschia sp. Os4]